MHYSVITRVELFAVTSATDQVALLSAPFREVTVDEVTVDRAVAEHAGRIRRESGVRVPDALIAATALRHRFGLVTPNRHDFEKVRGLRIRAPR